MKLITEIPLRRSKISLTRADRILTLGSCFSDNMAAHLRDAGFDMLANPFGTLYNPESIESAVRRLDSCEAYTEADCVEMGAGAGRTCSFEHHTSFARKSAEEFLENANRRLEESRRFWKGCNRVLVTYGTARVWRHGGRTVSNCLKRPAAEFTRDLLTLGRIERISENLVMTHPDKQFIFTVSPIRYLSEGAEANTISKIRSRQGCRKGGPQTAAPPNHRMIASLLPRTDHIAGAADIRIQFGNIKFTQIDLSSTAYADIG